MTIKKAQASRNNAKSAAFITNRIKALKKLGMTHDTAKYQATLELEALKKERSI
jgi:hypothetical protein